MDYSPSSIEYLFSEVPETNDKALEDLYYMMQRKFISLGYTIARKVPDHPAKKDAILNLCGAYNETMEALFRTLEPTLKDDNELQA